MKELAQAHRKETVAPRGGLVERGNNMNAQSQPGSIEAFRSSITPDLFEVCRYIAWGEIEKELEKYGGAIAYLNQAAERGQLNREVLEAGMRKEPYLYEVASLLLALPQSPIGFSDGRELPEAGFRLTSKQTEVAQLLIELGIPQLVPPKTDVQALVRVALTGLDAGKRRYRVGETIKERLQTVLEQAIKGANQDHKLQLERAPEESWPASARGRVECILAAGQRQRIAVASIFQTASGGRQKNELQTAFPALQRDLAEYGLNLLLVADGRGVRDARDSVLRALFTGVASCMTFRQAAAGRLLEEILRLVKTEPPSQEQQALKSLVHAAISSKGVVSATDLPSDLNRASLALATYANENPELDLLLDPAGRTISWRRKDMVEAALSLRGSFSPEPALSFFSKILGASSAEQGQSQVPLVFSVVELPDGDAIIPKRLLVGASSAQPNPELAKQLAALALAKTPESKMSVLLSHQHQDEESASALRRLQTSLTSNVVVIDSGQMLQMAQMREAPRSIVARQLLEQSDLIKASPFVTHSVTPSRMFYGRETEEAKMVSTLGSNSVALLGGRRIGKTSLMRHVEARLQQGGFATYFADCQTVRDWHDFAMMANRLWKVELDQPFRPAHFFELIRQIKASAQSKVVILLDEIDALLDWDKQHTDDQVPEALFKACRTVAQKGEVQFVFSGERTIASRLRDAQSPHWNFCEPLMLRQIDRNAADQLIVKPLEAMQIQIEDEEPFSSIAWGRTNGHPHLLQTLGDRLVRQLNERPTSARGYVSSRDLAELANSYSYAEHYLETYWGQAPVLERLLTLLVATGTSTLEGCRDFFQTNSISRSDDEIRSGLRMLEMYGITDPSEDGYRMRLEWFDTAIGFYGTAEKLIEQYRKAIK